MADLPNGIPPTAFNAAWCNGVQEELANTIEAAGIALDANTRTQMFQAIRRLVGGNVKTVTAGSTTLTADDSGLVLINAAAGAVALTLPPANALATLRFVFRRIDTVSSNTVIIVRQGADVIDETLTAFALNQRGDVRELVADGVAGWRSVVGKQSAAFGSPFCIYEPGGAVLQGGSVSLPPGVYNATLTLPVTFPTASMIALANDIGSGANSAGANATTNQINIYKASGQPSAVTYFWFAIGY